MNERWLPTIEKGYENLYPDMKTKYKYIEFEDQGHYWLCRNHKYGGNIGMVEYNARWKKWEYVPGNNTAYTADCIADIAQFMNQLGRKP